MVGKHMGKHTQTKIGSILILKTIYSMIAFPSPKPVKLKGLF